MFWTGYVAATHRRYDTANSAPGELLAGESVGQSFVARYDGLSGVEVHLATYGRKTDAIRGALVMHLRASPDLREDLATVTLQLGESFEENPWYLFSFPAIPDSGGRSYFVLIEAPIGEPGRSLSVFWYQPQPRGDPYANGEAYYNGQPTPGDLAFGLQYAAPPLQVWGSMIGGAGESTSPWVVWGLLILGAAGIGACMVLRFDGGEARLRKGWSLALALAVGLVYGLLFMLITPPWQGPDEYAHYAYVALLDRHDLDNGEVEALDLDGADRDTQLIEAVNASADRNDFTRRLRGNSAPGAVTRTDAYLFQQVRQPPGYYWLCAVALRAARLVGIPADPYTNPEVSLYVMRSVSLFLGLVVVALAWLALGLRLAMAVALLPMHTFVATSVNNDVLAEVAVSALFVAVMALVRSAFNANGDKWVSQRGLALAALCVLLAVVGVATKATAVAAGLPMLVGGILVWVGVGLARRSWTGRVLPINSRALRAGAVVLIVVVIAVGGFFSVFEMREEASPGWFVSYTPLESAQLVATESAHDGTHAIQLEATQGAVAMQRLMPPLIYHPDLRVTLTGWLRLVPAQAGATADKGDVTGEIAVMDGVREAGSATGILIEGGEWTRLEVTGDAQANAEEIELIIGVRDGSLPDARVQFDDMSLRVEAAGGRWDDPIYRAALVDPSGEQGRWAVRPLFEGIVPEEVRNMASALLNPQPFSKLALWSDYATQQYRSFWGSFGWLAIDLPDVAYLGIGCVLVLAAIGLVVRTVEGRKRVWGWHAWLALISVISLVVAIAVSFAKQMALTAYGGYPSIPQGRYLFVLTIPVVWLVVEGLRLLIDGRWPQAAGARRFVLANLLLLLALYGLLALVIPYYYS